MEITEDGEYYIDGEQLSAEELNTEINYSLVIANLRLLNRVESGDNKTLHTILIWG